MDCSMPGFPVHHQLLEPTQTHVHWIGDAIQPCHPLSSPSPPAFNLSQHQGLFQWVSSLHQVAGQSTGMSAASASVLPMNIQDWFPLGWTGWLKHIFISQNRDHYNQLLPMKNKFVYSCSVKIHALGFDEHLETFSVSCWLWKHFPCKKSICLKKW